MTILDNLKTCTRCGGPVHGPNKVCGGKGGGSEEEEEQDEASETDATSDSDRQNADKTRIAAIRGEQQDKLTAGMAAPEPKASGSSTSLTFK